jgi:hypothetical protein
VVTFHNFPEGHVAFYWKAENIFYSLKMKYANNTEELGFEMFPNLNRKVSVNS